MAYFAARDAHDLRRVFFCVVLVCSLAGESLEPFATRRTSRVQPPKIHVLKINHWQRGHTCLHMLTSSSSHLNYAAKSEQTVRRVKAELKRILEESTERALRRERPALL